MIVYADTSAVVKALLLESGTTEVGRWFAEADQVASSAITYAEACAAIGRTHRLRATGADVLRAQLTALDAQWDEFVVLPVAERAAGRAALRRGLRGMDAVQLSTALELRAAVAGLAPDAEVVFITFDRRLREAAEREGFATLGGPLTS